MCIHMHGNIMHTQTNVYMRIPIYKHRHIYTHREDTHTHTKYSTHIRTYVAISYGTLFWQ